MIKTRVIPSLLIKNGGLVKTVRFNKATYVGDPINAIKIFNDKEVDELAVIDIEASLLKKPPNFNLLDQVSKEAFMPLAYGGGINNLEYVRKILSLGFEKVIIDSYALSNPEFITKAADICGSQSVVVCIDMKRDLIGHLQVFDYIHKKPKRIAAHEYAVQVQQRGAGEIILYSVDRDGTYEGYDVKGIKDITSRLTIPVVALGGAGKIEDFSKAVKDGGASAVAAGSLFVFHGPHRAVLITYPEKKDIEHLIP
ncbi:MAG TPA: AglZ/HisF2 family acetamidino modification protein [Chitinivibrionales bacterium]|nr:AglZ/HisF2 family acetamidino modification protein [Chitinivibrionales bacterium]